MADMSETRIFTNIVAVLLAVHFATAWTLEMRPNSEPIQLNEEGEVNILFHADEPLVGCQFSFRGDATQYPMIDFSRGNSTARVAHIYPGGDWEVYAATYHGDGLEKGDCGVALTDVWYVQFMVGCRAKTLTGGWKYLDAAIHASKILGDTPFHVDITPRQAVVLPGSSLTVTCKSSTPGPIDSMCGFLLPHHPRDGFNFGPIVPPTSNATDTADYSFDSTKMRLGECGMTYKKIAEKDNGPLWCLAMNTVQGGTARIANIIVAKPPSEVNLALPTTPYRPGDVLTATCKVATARPAANITWFLGDSNVSLHAVDDSSVDDVWKWPWEEKERVQTLTMTLKREHNGKSLECRVAHEALTGKLEKKQVLRVRGGTKGGGTKGR